MPPSRLGRPAGWRIKYFGDMSARHIIPKRPVPPKMIVDIDDIMSLPPPAKVAWLYLRAKQQPLAYPTPAATKARLRPSHWWLAFSFWAGILKATHHVPKEAAASQLIFSNTPSLFISSGAVASAVVGVHLPLSSLRGRRYCCTNQTSRQWIGVIKVPLQICRGGDFITTVSCRGQNQHEKYNRTFKQNN